MKKIINSPEQVVNQMLNGIVQAHPDLALNAKYKVVTRKELRRDKVSLISGGGSGHEPAHAGFVGKGMLDAAVCGDVFASPSQIQVYKAIRATAGDKGTLLIIKNYSGDVMNFKNAALLAAEDGLPVDYIKVDDDIAVKDSLYTVGRRGVAGTVFVHKIAGAAAESGEELPKVKTIAEKVIANVKSIGFALSSCTVPAKGTPTFELGDDEMEYGVGIHGEPGISKIKMTKAGKLAERMVKALCDELCLETNGGDRVAVLINGFGASPLMELYLLYDEVAGELADRGIKVVRSFVGNYMTSIDMAGASLSILKLDNELEGLLNSPCETPALKVSGSVNSVEYSCPFAELVNQTECSFEVETSEQYAKIGQTLNINNFQYIVDVMSASIIANEVLFCEMDSHAGDGDFGMSVAKGFRQLKREWKEILKTSGDDVGAFLNSSSLVIMEHCGGASGPIWGSAFRAAGKLLAGKKEIGMTDFSQMMQEAVKGVQTTGERSFGRGAVVGDKTLIDALAPCADSWSACAAENKSIKEAFELGAAAAREGAESTKKIAARMGRAGTVGDRSIGYPDAGAYGLGVIFTDIFNALK